MRQDSILIIEQDPDDRQLITEVVAKLGYDCRSFEKKAAAFEFLEKNNSSLLITDIRFEETADTGVMGRLQRLKTDAPFAVMTGYGRDYTFDRVFGAGAQEFIKKPFTADQLENRLKRIFHERLLAHENKQLQKKQTQLNEQLRTLLSVAADLTAELDADRLFPLIIGKISEAMNAERSSLYVIDWDTQEMWTRVSQGIEPLRIKLGEGISGRVAQTGEIVSVEDAWQLPYFNRDFDEKHHFRTRSVLCIPINNRMGERFAVVQVINKIGRPAFSRNDQVFLQGLSSQVGIALENSLLYDEIKLSFDSFIRTLSAVVDARHPLTAGHSQRVTDYCLIIGEQMRLHGNQMEVLKIAALLHDIGKIGIRDDVLLKNGQFTPEERREMNRHPEKSKEILDEFRFPRILRGVPEIALYHHEKVNGGGYPRGLSGDQMPLESKIMAVADVFDALTSRREYPKYSSGETFDCEPMPLNKVITILQTDSGSHFDPEVVEAFIACLPKALIQNRGGHFPPAYVDDTIRMLAPEIEITNKCSVLSAKC
ncbi:MAG: HD domain-containing protein [Deltaproteobacteria bacterium]|nr:HD domain-containing protein [Deltaproteobacteria bacterium]